jgi:hypothetical protein
MSTQGDRVAGRRKVIFQLEALFLELILNCQPKCIPGGKRWRDFGDIKKYLFKIWILNESKRLL